MLLMHGVLNGEVPIAQSRAMRDALRRADKPVELVELAGADDTLRDPRVRLQTYERAIAFLQQHNPADPAPR